MRILINDNHVPHAWMIIRSMPDVEFIHPLWNGKLRPVPDNCKLVPFPQCLDLSYDAVIEDNPSLPSYAANSKKRIWMQHCEHDEGRKDMRDTLRYVFDKSDSVVVASKHKRATMRSLGLSNKVSVIGFYYDVEDWPKWACTSNRVGTSFNGMQSNTEVRQFCETISSGIEFEVIGFTNQASGCKMTEPDGFPEYQAACSALSAWCCCIIGDALPLCMMDAMAMGMPVATGNYSGAMDFCFHGYNCLINRRPPSDCDDWIRKSLILLRDDKEFAAQLGNNARETIRSIFPLSELRQKWLEVIQ